MATELRLPQKWWDQGWRIKIRGWEVVEPPHLTLMRKTRAWRFGLREALFLDRVPDPSEVPAELVKFLRKNLPVYIAAWDSRYPENPVSSTN